VKLVTIDVNGETYAKIQDGKPLYEADDGKPVAFDAPHAAATIKRLNGENKAVREAKEAAEAKLSGFAGIDDPEHARKALETLRNLDDKKLIDAGEVEKVKREAKEAFDRQFEAQYKPVEAERNALKSQLHNERLGTAFGRSKYIADKLAVPVDIVQARFGAHFGVGDDGRIVAKGPDGNPIYSRAKPGEVADFDEALEHLVEAYPYRDSIMKGSGASGGGAGGLRSADGRRTITRAQFDTMSPAEKSTVARDKGVSIVD
jgi:soluble cytochrome b562